MLADSTVTGTPPFFLPQTPAGSAAAAAAATRALIMNPAAAAYLAASGAGAAPFLYGNNALRYESPNPKHISNADSRDLGNCNLIAYQTLMSLYQN